jgi:small neutral amino acid transporter SnatA (MarC family)
MNCSHKIPEESDVVDISISPLATPIPAGPGTIDTYLNK